MLSFRKLAGAESWLRWCSVLQACATKLIKRLPNTAKIGTGASTWGPGIICPMHALI